RKIESWLRRTSQRQIITCLNSIDTYRRQMMHMRQNYGCRFYFRKCLIGRCLLVGQVQGSEADRRLDGTGRLSRGAPRTIFQPPTYHWSQRYQALSLERAAEVIGELVLA